MERILVDIYGILMAIVLIGYLLVWFYNEECKKRPEDE